MDSQLISYILSSRAQGFDDARIRAALVGAGWPQSNIDEAFSNMDAPGEPSLEAAAKTVQAGTPTETPANEEDVLTDTVQESPWDPVGAGRTQPVAIPISSDKPFASAENQSAQPASQISTNTARNSRLSASLGRVLQKRMLMPLIIVLGFGAGYFGVRAYGIPEPIRMILGDLRAALPFFGANVSPAPTSPINTSSPEPGESQTPTPAPGIGPITPEKSGLKKFASEEEFSAYLSDAAENAFGLLGGSFLSGSAAIDPGVPAVPTMTGMNEIADGIGGGGGASRVSQTNVQVRGIDEPDIVKTDGKHIYYARLANHFGYPRPLFFQADPQSAPSFSDPIAPGSMPEPYRAPTPAPSSNETLIINAFPPDALKKTGAIAETGNLILSDKTLIVLPEAGSSSYAYYEYPDEKLAEPAMRGFDVTDPQTPKEQWVITLSDRTSFVDARLSDGILYVITRTAVSHDHPCPIVPLLRNGIDIAIPCTDVWHPIGTVPADATYTILAINPADGAITKKVSVLAPSNSVILMMSQNAVYLSYALPPDIIALAHRFFTEDAADLISSEALARIKKLSEYDISQSAKLTELAIILQKVFGAALSDRDEALRIQNELSNRAASFFAEHARELAKTAIVKFDARTLDIAASGEVPGSLLNQWALDEYNGFLRIASTIDPQSGWWGIPFVAMGAGGTSVQSVNDVYVLDGKLAIIGSVKDLGVTERIFGVRFVEDRGYVVTFRQTDPFYVLDLSIPTAPAMRGELKIPGFSSYLHPIDKNLVLGVGQEGSQVKASLFDVSNPAAPVEKAKYMLNEYWSGVAETHHAFLLDSKHKMFFLPGMQGGYIFSYGGTQLKMVVAVADIKAERAVFLDDYLYIISPQKIVVFDERNWQKVKELAL
ncbi:MAG: beta-propeller domain-containing protein [bacterium]|nr:beta-propeller domain-containing protein [bacterium]